MGDQPNVIVINGKQYDAKTGMLLTENATVKPTPMRVNRATRGGAIDGFQRPKKNHVASHAVHKKNERSQTLMRTAVKKPLSAPKLAKLEPITSQPTIKPSASQQMDAARQYRAKNVLRSAHVSKFGPQSVPSVQKQVDHLPVVVAPQNAYPTTATAPEITDFQSIMHASKSHEQPAIDKASLWERLGNKLHVSSRVASFGSMTAAFVLLAGFFVYQNIPNLAMQIAATRSGVEASMPGYRPAGFSLNGPIEYSPGQITMTFRSASDNRKFSVMQRSSSWNSESLLDNFVTTSNRTYQTFQDKGKTIYIYDGSNATWVDQGVWYQIEAGDVLNSDQLIRLANSL